MPLLVLVSTFLVAVYGQARDPTQVCFPDVYQFQIYSIDYNELSVVAFDFIKQLRATRYPSGNRFVVDLSNNMAATINVTDGTCFKSVYDSTNKIDPQCLPANSTPLTDNTGTLGLNPGGLEIEGWEFTPFMKVRYWVTKSSPAFPVFKQFIYLGRYGTGVYLYLNPKTSIDDPTIFNIPPVCPIFTPDLTFTCCNWKDTCSYKSKILD